MWPMYPHQLKITPISNKMEGKERDREMIINIYAEKLKDNIPLLEKDEACFFSLLSRNL